MAAAGEIHDLEEKLLKKGWHLSPEGITECLKSFGQVKHTVENVVKSAVNFDLKEIGFKVLTEEVKRGQVQSVEGPLVLQIQKVRNISAPKANEESSTAPRLLKIQLTDGYTTCFALENYFIQQLSLSTPPGTKVRLKGTVPLSSGFLLLEPRCLEIVGGKVEKLVAKWEANRSINRQLSRPGVDSEGPPLFVPFDIKSTDLSRTTTFGKNAQNTKCESTAAGTSTGTKGERGSQIEENFNKARHEKIQNAKHNSQSGRHDANRKTDNRNTNPNNGNNIRKESDQRQQAEDKRHHAVNERNQKNRAVETRDNRHGLFSHGSHEDSARKSAQGQKQPCDGKWARQSDGHKTVGKKPEARRKNRARGGCNDDDSDYEDVGSAHTASQGTLWDYLEDRLQKKDSVKEFCGDGIAFQGNEFTKNIHRNAEHSQGKNHTKQNILHGSGGYQCRGPEREQRLDQRGENSGNRKNQSGDQRVSKDQRVQRQDQCRTIIGNQNDNTKDERGRKDRRAGQWGEHSGNQPREQLEHQPAERTENQNTQCGDRSGGKDQQRSQRGDQRRDQRSVKLGNRNDQVGDQGGRKDQRGVQQGGKPEDRKGEQRQDQRGKQIGNSNDQRRDERDRTDQRGAQRGNRGKQAWDQREDQGTNIRGGRQHDQRKDQLGDQNGIEQQVIEHQNQRGGKGGEQGAKRDRADRQGHQQRGEFREQCRTEIQNQRPNQNKLWNHSDESRREQHGHGGHPRDQSGNQRGDQRDKRGGNYQHTRDVPRDQSDSKNQDEVKFRDKKTFKRVDQLVDSSKNERDAGRVFEGGSSKKNRCSSPTTDHYNPSRTEKRSGQYGMKQDRSVSRKLEKHDERSVAGNIMNNEDTGFKNKDKSFGSARNTNDDPNGNDERTNTAPPIQNNTKIQVHKERSSGTQHWWRQGEECMAVCSADGQDVGQTFPTLPAHITPSYYRPTSVPYPVPVMPGELMHLPTHHLQPHYRQEGGNIGVTVGINVLPDSTRQRSKRPTQAYYKPPSRDAAK